VNRRGNIKDRGEQVEGGEKGRQANTALREKKRTREPGRGMGGKDSGKQSTTTKRKKHRLSGETFSWLDWPFGGRTGAWSLGGNKRSQVNQKLFGGEKKKRVCKQANHAGVSGRSVTKSGVGFPLRGGNTGGRCGGPWWKP